MKTVERIVNSLQELLLKQQYIILSLLSNHLSATVIYAGLIMCVSKVIFKVLLSNHESDV